MKPIIIKNKYKNMKNTTNYDKIPYCLSHNNSECSEDCCEFDKCIREERRNYKFSRNNNFNISINGDFYTVKEITEIIEKYKKEEDKKYTICDKCHTKFLENTKFNMVTENLDDNSIEPGTAIGYLSTPFITGFQITSTCGNGKKIKLCDNCIEKLIKFINEE